MCEDIKFIFTQGKCRDKRCEDPSLTPRCKECPNLGSCKRTTRELEVPIACPQHRKEAIEKTEANYFQILSTHKINHPITGQRVNKCDCVHAKVLKRVRLYPEMCEDEYEQQHEAVIHQVYSCYARYGRLDEYLADKTGQYFDFARAYRVNLKRALDNFKDNVVLSDAPIEQPESVRRLFWKDDDPLVKNLGI